MLRIKRKQRERDNRINDIIDAAEQLFFSKGYEKTTMDDIVKKAEFSKSTLYSYFESKEEIFLLVHMKGLEKRRLIISAMKKEKTGIDKLRVFGQEYYKFYKKYPEYLRLQLNWSTNGINLDKINHSTFKRFKQLNESCVSEIRKSFQMELQNSKHPSAGDIDRLVSYFLQTLRTVLNQSLFPVDPLGRFNDHEYYLRYLDLFLLSVKAISSNDHLEHD